MEGRKGGKGEGGGREGRREEGGMGRVGGTRNMQACQHSPTSSISIIS